MLNKNTVNKVILMGHINTEPRTKQTEEQLFVSFTMVTTEQFKFADDQQIHQEYHQINVPIHLVDADLLIKGACLYVQGRIQTKMFLDNKNIKHYRSEIVATSVDVIQPALTQHAI